MNTYYQIGVQYVKLTAEGKEKKTTEQYLFSAVDFTDAEAKARLEFAKFIPEDYTITKIVKTKFSEIILSEGDKFYKGRVVLVIFDENTGKAKKTASDSLIQADSLKDAEKLLSDSWAQVVLGVEIIGVTESKIIDVFSE